MYCPEGSGAPTVAAAGYYTSPELSAFAIVALQCPPGSHCSGGERRYCPAGTYQGGVLATSLVNCTLCIDGGKYCPPGTATPEDCGDDRYYCPPGGRERLQAGAGSYTLGPSGFKFANAVCPLGYYCPGDGGVYMCAAGRWSGDMGRESECSANCSAGYVCPSGSSNSTASVCPAGRFSLSGAASCSACPSGTFGGTVALQSPACSGVCPAGYYCPGTAALSRSNPA